MVMSQAWINGAERKSMKKPNCWEYKKCGREPGGAKTNELGIRAASTEARVQGVNSGKNAGRTCWALRSTLCGSQVQGVFAQKLSNCLKCEFYQLVGTEEGVNHVSAREILALLK